MPPVAAVRTPASVTPVGTLACLLRAIRTGQTVIANYQSISRQPLDNAGTLRHSFGGLGWHASAYYFGREDFRDLFSARMLSVELGEPSSVDLTLDT